ncbi:MAG: ComEC family competence protein, partial [Planctomycetales bacterium]|nr:ComEC family competence protein [Planctomycetales bacterium]
MAVAALGGMALDRWFSSAHAEALNTVPTQVSWGVWATLWCGFTLAWGASRIRRSPWAGWWTLASVAALAGLWSHDQWRYFGVDDLSLFADETPQPAVIEAIVCDAPDPPPAETSNPLRPIPLPRITEGTVRALAIRDGTQWRSCSGLVRLRVAGDLVELLPGDRIRFVGKLGRPPPPLNPGQFDWRSVERGRRRLSEAYCSASECVMLLDRPTMGAAALLDRVRKWCRWQLTRCVGPRQAGLALALTLGDRQQLDDAQKDAFLHTGSIHLLVISGMHVGMLAALIWWIAPWF